MFNSISGILTGKQETCLYLLTNGIEWDIIISHNTFHQLPEVGKEYKIYTYLYHREDKLQLFGFYSTGERDLFFNLIKVEGIGPTQAVRILSGITPQDFIKALETNNISRLEEIRGLGKKTAQKILLKLAGKLTLGENEDKTHGDIIKALTGMGFDAQQAREAVRNAGSEIDSSMLQLKEYEKQLLKLSLEKISRGTY